MMKAPSRRFHWPHAIADAMSAQIFNWEGHVGVDYIFHNGVRDAHRVCAADWPVIRRLKCTGKLFYQDDEVRDGIDEIFRLGLDH